MKNLNPRMREQSGWILIVAILFLVGGYFISYLVWRKPFTEELTYTETNSDGSIYDVSESFPPTPDHSGYGFFYPLLRIDPFMAGEESEKASEIWYHKIDPVIDKLRIVE